MVLSKIGSPGKPTMNGSDNYYNILGCQESDSYEVIKKRYHEKARVCHPDKRTLDIKNTISFAQINKAWKTLSNPELRRVYNAKLREEQLSKQSLVFEKIVVNELVFDSVSNSYTKNCRCGGQFIINAEDIAEYFDCDISVECDTCSLVIHITEK